VQLIQEICLLFSGAKYIIRLDDACDTQYQAKWSEIERILQLNNIKPMVAVIPSNEDVDLHYNESNPNFWSVVKRWQDNGWVIGQHGFKHQRHSVKKQDVIVPLHCESEFAGLSFHAQCSLIEKGYGIMRNKSIYPRVWISPCHTFDLNTLRAIKTVTQIKVISDGITDDF
jgi:predicted deacetylase